MSEFNAEACNNQTNGSYLYLPRDTVYINYAIYNRYQGENRGRGFLDQTIS